MQRGSLDRESLSFISFRLSENSFKLFEDAYPDITVDITVANNDQMYELLKENDGGSFDLVQPSSDRIHNAQTEFLLYKPIELALEEVLDRQS
mgnify:CR=1 FL=1